MASSLALRRLLSSNLPSSSAFLPIPAARLFTTNASRRYDSDDSDETDLESYRRHDRSLPLRRNDFLSDVFAPSPFSVGQNLTPGAEDQVSENPFLSSTRRGWDGRETEEGLHLRFDMPGLGKEDVKVSVEKNTLVFRGEGGHVDGEEEPRRYSTRIQLPERVFKTDGVKAEMKNGVLKVVVPKIEEEERSDVFHIKEMFFKTEMQWNVVIPAESLDAKGLMLQKDIVVRLLDDFAKRKATKDLGYLLALKTVEKIGEGKVRQHSGDVLFPVTFSAISFKLFRGEILEGVVHKVLKQGVMLSCGPVGNIYLSSSKMPDYNNVPGENPIFYNDKMSKIEKGVTYVSLSLELSGLRQKGNFKHWLASMLNILDQFLSVISFYL